MSNPTGSVNTPVIRGPASYFPAIEAKYGQPIAHWMKVLDATKGRKQMEHVEQLKRDHQMGRGQVNNTQARSHQPNLLD